MRLLEHRATQWLFRVLPTLQFAVAFLWACWWELKVRGITDKRRVDEMTMRVRLSICRQCPIYYAPLQTCGSPLKPNDRRGCNCYMPVKATRFANCWDYDLKQGQSEFGWPDELNSFPYEQHTEG